MCSSTALVCAVVWSQVLQCCLCEKGGDADDGINRASWFVVLSAVLLWIYCVYRAWQLVKAVTFTEPQVGSRNASTQTTAPTRNPTPVERAATRLPREVIVTTGVGELSFAQLLLCT